MKTVNHTNDRHINIIGAGLAGCEAAWQAAKRGVEVRLYEMKPLKYSQAHHIDSFAELVCSNSLRSDRLENAAGLLKEEMRMLDSLIMRCADASKIPAGGALAVDRTGFSKMVTDIIKSNPLVTVISGEITRLPGDGVNIIATGPLTSDAFMSYLQNLIGIESLHFFDAAAPIVTGDSIDRGKVFEASRYGRGGSDYINCPMTAEQYQKFYEELINAEVAPIKDFERNMLFSGCMPVESMAKQGRDTLRFGPLKPRGLRNPATGREPYAVVQLRRDNAAGTLFNIVGFQTHLKWPEQKRVFGLIPGLENAEFVRYGVMHRNTFINSPKLLENTYELKSKPGIFFAGQITGVEGYLESASSGMVAGINAARSCTGRDKIVFSPETATGALANYISSRNIKKFEPMNINFGIILSYPDNIHNLRDKKTKNLMISENALKKMYNILAELV